MSSTFVAKMQTSTTSKNVQIRPFKWGGYVIVNHAHQVIIISNPKTGSKSLEAALASFQEEPELHSRAVVGLYTKGHIPADELREIVGDDVWDRYYKIAFVRNPWDWFVSQHFYNLQRRGKPYNLECKLSIQEIMETYEFLRSYRGVKWADSACQNAFICDSTGTPLVDFIGRFESLATDFYRVALKLECKVNMPHKNASTHRNYREYFNDQTRDLIHNLYERDIEVFSYRF